MTSGVVYPTAILGLSEKFRFRSIGGTSAGAIAAALTAAAEYGRCTGQRGFDEVREVEGETRDPEKLLSLFEPDAATAPLFRMALATIGARKPVRDRSLVDWAIAVWIGLRAAYPVAWWIGHLISIVLVLWIALAARSTVRAIGGELDTSGVSTLALSVVTTLAFVVMSASLVVLCAGIAAYRASKMLIRKVQQNGLGLCSGMGNGSSDGQSALTPWLHKHIQAAAGRNSGDPLTFADLASARVGVTLRMMTTNLSQERPSQLPFDKKWIFSEQQFRSLFPSEVVEYLKREAHRSDSAIPPKGYHFLPNGDALPIVVAARMSLSFPFLFGAVPLYGIRATAFLGKDKPVQLVEHDLQRNWLSDGGITSNFPIHFFDHWLPSRPTFGISLTEMPTTALEQEGTIKDEFIAAQKPQQSQELRGGRQTSRDAVYLPAANDQVSIPWKPLEARVRQDGRTAGPPSAYRFAAAIISTALGHRDSLQSELLGYRERIVQVRLGEGEGGLNLASDEQALAKMQVMGWAAAGKLKDEFNFDHHRWVRLGSLLAHVETELERLDDDVSSAIVKLAITAGSAEARFPYRDKFALKQDALAFVPELRSFGTRWRGKVFKEGRPPVDSVLRVSPKI